MIDERTTAHNRVASFNKKKTIIYNIFFRTFPSEVQFQVSGRQWSTLTPRVAWTENAV